MYTYLVKFSVNGTRTEQIVKANDSVAARKLILAQYGATKVYISEVKKI